jgi:hypothetical protein
LTETVSEAAFLTVSHFSIEEFVEKVITSPSLAEGGVEQTVQCIAQVSSV